MNRPPMPPGDTCPQPPNRVERLVFTGFMGSGKTTLGRLLAAQLDWQFVDLDEEIERIVGRTVAEIFAEKGEHIFRDLETTALQTMLHETSLVMALGGGAIETPANRELLAGSSGTLTVLLTAPSATLYERCLRQRSDPQAGVRPLLSNPESFAERLSRREELYRGVASLVIDTSGQTPGQSIRSVIRGLRSTL